MSERDKNKYIQMESDRVPGQDIWEQSLADDNEDINRVFLYGLGGLAAGALAKGAAKKLFRMRGERLYKRVASSGKEWRPLLKKSQDALERADSFIGGKNALPLSKTVGAATGAAIGVNENRARRKKR